jgi:hypothetical protein
MFVWIAGRRQKVIKDTGACCSTMPESLALDLVNVAFSNPLDTPIVDILEYQPPIQLRGFAASKNVAVKYGVVVLLEFRDVVTGRAASVPVEFRVIPTEVDTGGSVLLGASTVGPELLDIDTTDKHHIIRRLGNMKCERAEKTTGGGLHALEEIRLVSLHLMSEEVWLEPGECKKVSVSAPPSWLCPSGVALVSSSETSDVSVCEGLAPFEEGQDAIEVLISAPEDEAVVVTPGAAVGWAMAPPVDLEVQLDGEDCDVSALTDGQQASGEQINEVVFEKEPEPEPSKAERKALVAELAETRTTLLEPAKTPDVRTLRPVPAVAAPISRSNMIPEDVMFAPPPVNIAQGQP